MSDIANHQSGDRQPTALLPCLLDLIERDVPQDHADEGKTNAQIRLAMARPFVPVAIGAAYCCG